MNDKYDIVPVRDHYEVRRNGNFMCSADTVTEAAKEIDKDKYKNGQNCGWSYNRVPTELARN